MSDTGLKTTGAVVSAGTWTNMTTTRINASDNSRATTTSSSFVAATLNNYGFGIPSGATINGIEIQCEFNNSNGGFTSTVQFSLSYNNGTNYTAAKSDTVVGTTDTTRTYGGAADTWGRSWTDSEFADGTFLVKIEGKTSPGTTCRVDWLAIKVYYTAATGTTGAAFLLRMI